MPVFRVEKAPDGEPCFRVLAPDGEPVGEIQEFLMYMATCGRSAYTLHSYATGLAHFFGWLGDCDTAADAVTRNTVARYIAAFGGAPKQRLGSRRITQSAAKEDRRRT